MKKKPLLLTCASLIAAAAGIFLFLLSPVRQDSSQISLHALTDRIFRQEICASTLNLHYTLADPEAYGIDDYPIKLGTFSAESLKNSLVLTENNQAALNAIDRSCLSRQDRFTYDVLEYTLDTEQEGYAWFYYQEPLSPGLGVQAQLPVLLAEYAFYTRDDVSDYLALLTKVGEYFGSVLEFEQEKADRSLFMSDETVDAITDQCIDFINSSQDSYLEKLFEEKLDGLTNLSEEDRSACLSKNRELITTCVVPAYQKLVNGLLALKGSGTNSRGLYYLPRGAEYYSYLVRATTGSDKTVEAIDQLLQKKRTDYSAAMRRIVSEHPSLLASMDISIESRSPEYILEYLKQSIRQDFPDLPQTLCTVKQVHPSLEQYSSPAFYLTPPLDQSSDNVIYINSSSGYQGVELFTTLAHEGYPGHLYQTVYSHTYCPNPLQSILNIGGYTEGWATYAELYSYGLSGLDKDTARLLMLNKAWTLNLYSTMDIGIHYYGWTLYDTYEFLTSYGIDNLELSKKIYQAIVEDPANYLKYYVGYLEFDALRERAANTLGSSFDLKDFHQYLLALGPAPFSLLEKETAYYAAQKD